MAEESDGRNFDYVPKILKIMQKQWFFQTRLTHDQIGIHGHLRFGISDVSRTTEMSRRHITLTPRMRIVRLLDGYDSLKRQVVPLWEQFCQASTSSLLSPSLSARFLAHPDIIEGASPDKMQVQREQVRVQVQVQVQRYVASQVGASPGMYVRTYRCKSR